MTTHLPRTPHAPGRVTGPAGAGRRRRPAVATLVLAALAALATVAVAGCSSGDSASDGTPGGSSGVPAGGEPVSGATLVPLGGGEATTLVQTGGGRPMVVNLWASWCVPCRTEMPELEGAHQRFGDRVVFVGVTDDPNTEAARQVAADTKVTYPLLFDEAGDVQVDLGVANLPATVFVDGQGRIVSSTLGKVTADDLEAGIAGLLGGAS